MNPRHDDEPVTVRCHRRTVIRDMAYPKSGSSLHDWLTLLLENDKDLAKVDPDLVRTLFHAARKEPVLNGIISKMNACILGDRIEVRMKKGDGEVCVATNDFRELLTRYWHPQMRKALVSLFAVGYFAAVVAPNEFDQKVPYVLDPVDYDVYSFRDGFGVLRYFAVQVLRDARARGGKKYQFPELYVMDEPYDRRKPTSSVNMALPHVKAMEKLLANAVYFDDLLTHPVVMMRATTQEEKKHSEIARGQSEGNLPLGPKDDDVGRRMYDVEGLRRSIEEKLLMEMDMQKKTSGESVRGGGDDKKDYDDPLQKRDVGIVPLPRGLMMEELTLHAHETNYFKLWNDLIGCIAMAFGLSYAEKNRSVTITTATALLERDYMERQVSDFQTKLCLFFELMYFWTYGNQHADAGLPFSDVKFNFIHPPLNVQFHELVELCQANILPQIEGENIVRATLSLPPADFAYGEVCAERVNCKPVGEDDSVETRKRAVPRRILEKERTEREMVMRRPKGAQQQQPAFTSMPYSRQRTRARSIPYYTK